MKIQGLISKPYVIGFGLARPLCKPSFSVVPVETDIYTHPVYDITKHFIVTFNIYSLGLVLLLIRLC